MLNVCMSLELAIRKAFGNISESTITLSIDDPKEQLGSGGATINALLVVTEFLSAKKGFTVIIQIRYIYIQLLLNVITCFFHTLGS